MHAQTRYRLAKLVSSGDTAEGRCTVSLIVDRSTDVEIRRDMATLRTNYGRPARWDRFDCTGPLPVAPANLRIRAIEGNGRITLTHDSDDGGVAIVHVRNPDDLDQMYTFDVYWSSGRPSTASGFAERSADDESAEACRSAAETRIRNDGYRGVRIGGMNVDDRGVNNFVTGTATANRTNAVDEFSFSCRVTPDGQVRRLDVTRR